MKLREIFRRAKNKDSAATIVHYAPDVNLAPTDYVFPISAEARLRSDEKRIKEFLQATQPDSLCEAFYDRYAESDDAHIAAIIACQQAGHLAAAREIAEKHKAEISRLNYEISATDEQIRLVEENLERLQEIISKFN